jgi:hypothetical protein
MIALAYGQWTGDGMRMIARWSDAPPWSLSLLFFAGWIFGTWFILGCFDIKLKGEG